MREVLAFHVILTAYGFWLPNDPRGSWSVFVRQWDLLQFGGAARTQSRRSLAGDAHDADLRMRAKDALRFPAVTFSGLAAREVGGSFADTARDSGYRIHACAILPDHAHLVIARHAYAVEQVVRRLKQNATLRLTRADLHPLRQYAQPGATPPSPWARKFWKVFLWEEADIVRAVEYVRQNPVRAGLRAQTWRCVTPWEG